MVRQYKRDIIAVCLIAFIFLGICIYKLTMSGEFSGDEFFTLQDTLGFVYTGQWRRWDFGTNTLMEYGNGAKLDFFLLALWIRAVGQKAILLRSLTVFYSLLTVFSFYYIVRRLTGSFEWTLLASLFWTLNSTFITLSTIVRGYGLMCLLMSWVFYFSYQALHDENKINWRCAFAAAVLLVAAFYVRVYVVLYMVGLASYVLWNGIRTKNRKFCVLGGAFWLVVVSMFVGTAIRLDTWLPFLYSICNRLRKYAAFGFRNVEYLIDLGRLFYSIPITVAALVLLLVCVFRKCDKIEEKQKNILVYCSSIVITTLLLFLFVVDWQCSNRYLLPIYPLAIIVFTGGVYLYSRNENGICRGFFYGILFCCLFTSVKETLTAGSGEGGNFQEAYEELAEYQEGSVAFITGHFLREYYAKEILGNYIWQPMTSKRNVPDTDNLEELSKIAREHPRGIITCDDEKWYHFRNSFWQLLNMDAFKRITGPGVDETGVSNWEYHICHRAEGEEINPDESDKVLFGYNFGGAVQINEKEDKTVVKLQLNGSVSERTLLCLKINQYHADGKEQRHVQLVLEPNDSQIQYYRIELENKGFIPNKSVLDDNYYIYTGSEEPEQFEDCYVM